MIIVLVGLLVSVTASAQFTIYRSATVPERTTSQDYSPFTIYQPSLPVPQDYQSTPQPKPTQYTLNGYYKKSDKWYKTPIKVSILGDDIKLVGVKVGNNWSGCSSKVSEVGRFDTQEVQDNFTKTFFL